MTVRGAAGAGWLKWAAFQFAVQFAVQSAVQPPSTTTLCPVM
jgi:hypothetical protein